MNQIEINKISKVFKTRGIEVSALKNISFKINKGDFFALIGLNGAGKTTLIRILSGILFPNSGEVKICNMSYQENEFAIKNNIGVVMGGEHSLYGKLTAVENLEFFASFYNYNASLLNNRITELLDLLKLNDKKNLLVETYSKGMKQKLLIAKALLHNPEILILDEPCNGIDIVTKLEIKKLLKTINDKYKKTIILTTHDLHDAEDLCNKLCILQEGKIIAQGTFEEVYQSYFKNKIFNIILKKRMSQEIYNSIIEKQYIIDIIREEKADKYEYDIVFDADCTDINLEGILDHIPMKYLVSINEKKISLEFLLQYLVEKNENSD